MNDRRRIVTRRTVAVSSLVLGMTVVIGYVLIPVTTRYAQPGYAFDTSDRAQVSGYSDQVVVAQVSEPGTTPEEEPPRTTYSVRVEQSLKGSLGEGASVEVVQHGVDLSGKRTQLLSGVEPLSAGGTYVLALTQDDRGALTLVSGPHSPETVEATQRGSSSSRAVETWEEAIENERWPEALS